MTISEIIEDLEVSILDIETIHINCDTDSTYSKILHLKRAIGQLKAAKSSLMQFERGK